MNHQIMDRQRGCLFGLAVGDALGAAVEFAEPGSFRPVTGFRAGGPHGLAPGEWTDDTSMALALADSLAHSGWNLADQMQRYVAWFQTGRYSVTETCFDIGNATRAALIRFQCDGDPRRSGSREDSSSGNGSIMRLAPVPIRFSGLLAHDADGLAELAAESSLPTHASAQCLSGCQYLATVLAGLIQGLSRETVLSPDWAPVERLLAGKGFHAEVAEVAAGSFRRKAPPSIRGSGYVVASLEAALWAFHRADDFAEAVLAAVNLGDDADTTGAVCGQLAGAAWGESGIPESWRRELAKPEMIERALAGLLHGEVDSDEVDSGSKDSDRRNSR